MTSTVASAINTVRKAAVNTFGVDAFTTSGASGLYNRARPSYPPQAIQKILSLLPDGSKARVIEVGAGTGIFTSNLANAPSASDKIEAITAVEPSSGMRQGFAKNEGLAPFMSGDQGKKPYITVKDGAFGDIPVPDGTVDLIIGAQTFHWAHPDYQSAVAEFARVLKPSGTLALIWNLEDRNKARWVAQIRDAYEAYEAGTPQYRLGWWREMFETDAYKENFAQPERHDFELIHPATSQQVVDRVLSKSYITAQPQAEQKTIAANVRKILENGDDRVWLDEKEGVFEYPYQTNLYLMRRR